MRIGVTVALLMAVPMSASAQRVRGEGVYNRYGYDYSPWQLTSYNAVEFRTKCEGEQIKGMNTGPIRWVIEFHNRTANAVHFDYVIQAPDARKPVSASGRVDVKPNKIFQRLASVPTSRCDEGVITAIGNVRLGADINGTPYANPDRP